MDHEDEEDDDDHEDEDEHGHEDEESGGDLFPLSYLLFFIGFLTMLLFDQVIFVTF